MVRYTWRVGLMGIAVLGLSLKLGSAWLALRDTAPAPGLQKMAGGTFLVAGNEPLMFLAATIIAAFVGLMWIGMMCRPALVLDEHGVRGFTVLGPKRIAWPDIERIELQWHAIYKNQMTIHAALCSPSGGLGVSAIPIPLSRVDRSKSQIIAAMHRYRPDIPVRENALLSAMTQRFVDHSTGAEI